MKTRNIWFVIVAAAIVAPACNVKTNSGEGDPAIVTVSQGLTADMPGHYSPDREPARQPFRRLENRTRSASCAVAADGSGCADDRGCAAGTVCSCHEPGAVGTCVVGECRTDADCAADAKCAVAGSITGQDCKTRAQEFRCTRAGDECVHSLDCTALAIDATCVFDRQQDRRICTRFICRL